MRNNIDNSYKLFPIYNDSFKTIYQQISLEAFLVTFHKILQFSFMGLFCFCFSKTSLLYKNETISLAGGVVLNYCDKE